MSIRKFFNAYHVHCYLLTKLIMLLICLSFSNLTQANNQSPVKAKTNISVAYYHDNRDYNTTSIVISSNHLPNDFSVWGFTDLHSAQESSGQRYDAAHSFSEYRLSHNGLGKKIGLPKFGLQAEYNDATPGDNNLVRLGLTYKWKFPLAWLQLRAFPVESDNDGGQVSLIYGLKLSKNISFDGFADYNIRENQSNEWVIEPQFKMTFAKQFSWVLEYRYNGFENSNPSLDGSGLATGLWINF